MEIKNIKKAAERIQKAINKRENIIICGDSDLDGVTSVIVLEEAIKFLGGVVSTIYFPDREDEGYGITRTSLKFFQRYSPALLISVDFGISNFKEIKIARKKGFEVIVVDHHEVLGKIPEANIVVDPKQKGDKYPFKQLAAVGVVFKLTQALLGKKMTVALEETFLELVALGTVADMMPREADNKKFIDKGLPYLETSFRPGIKVFFEKKIYEEYPDISQKVFKMISLLNVRDVFNGMPASFRLLTAQTLEEAGRISKTLFEKGKVRREKITETILDIERAIAKKDEPIIFEGSSFFDLGLLSSVASILCNEYEKPVFLFKKKEKESQGTIRSPKSVNSVELLKKCARHLTTYGGHPQASGFRLKNRNIDKFKKCLIKNIKL
jgi:single-stranded-DNA-specific exonuclease